MNLKDNNVPCFVCDKDIEIMGDTVSNVEKAAINNGIHCKSIGNYGSRMLDEDYGVAHFAVCDVCFATRTHKVVFKEGPYIMTYSEWLKARLSRKKAERRSSKMS
jgi:hypothetical protein